MQPDKPDSYMAHASQAVPMAQPVDVSDHDIQPGYAQPGAYLAPPSQPMFQASMAQQGFHEPPRQGIVQHTVPVVQGIAMPSQPAFGQPGLAMPPAVP